MENNSSGGKKQPSNREVNKFPPSLPHQNNQSETWLFHTIPYHRLPYISPILHRRVSSSWPRSSDPIRAASPSSAHSSCQAATWGAKSAARWPQKAPEALEAPAPVRRLLVAKQVGRQTSKIIRNRMKQQLKVLGLMDLAWMDLTWFYATRCWFSFWWSCHLPQEVAMELASICNGEPINGHYSNSKLSIPSLCQPEYRQVLSKIIKKNNKQHLSASQSKLQLLLSPVLYVLPSGDRPRLCLKRLGT